MSESSPSDSAHIQFSAHSTVSLELPSQNVPSHFPWHFPWPCCKLGKNFGEYALKTLPVINPPLNSPLKNCILHRILGFWRKEKGGKKKKLITNPAKCYLATAIIAQPPTPHIIRVSQHLCWDGIPPSRHQIVIIIHASDECKFASLEFPS